MVDNFQLGQNQCHSTGVKFYFGFNFLFSGGDGWEVVVSDFSVSLCPFFNFFDTQTLNGHRA